MQLTEGTLLQGGKYKIESVLGQGGFGITYLATQVALNRRVAIKEFFMKEYCERDEITSHITMGTKGSRELVERFRQKFIKEAQTIAGLVHTHIISIYDVFEENGTAYYVMEYIDGGSLKDRIEVYGAMSDSEASNYILQISDALEYLHDRRIMHLDIKPSNILLRNNGEAVLIDFGISKRYNDTGSQTSSTPIGISKGYAPLEQYKQGGVKTFSPSTDIYSLGATLFYLLTRQQPPEASDVNDEGLPALPTKISPLIRKAIQCAMQPRCKDRPQSIKEFLALLNEGISPGSEDETTILNTPKNKIVVEEHSSSIPKTQQVFPWLWGVIALFLILCTIWLSRTYKTSNIEEDNSFVVWPDSTTSGLTTDSTITTSPISHDSLIQNESQNTGKIGQTKTNYQHNEISTDQIVDLGLSVRWAGWNLGASTPEEYGNLYYWGDSTGTASSGPTFISIYDFDDICGSEYDIARTQLGKYWRMPTAKEFMELRDKCKITWTTYKKIGGYKITGPNGNNIFLPAAGIKNGQNIGNRGSIAYYWTGSMALVGGRLVKRECGCAFQFKDSVKVMPGNVALPIRPVTPKEGKQKQEEQQRKKKRKSLEERVPKFAFSSEIRLNSAAEENVAHSMLQQKTFI